MFGINRLKKENKLLKVENDNLHFDLFRISSQYSSLLEELENAKRNIDNLTHQLIEKDNELSLLRAVKKAEKFSDNEKYY